MSCVTLSADQRRVLNLLARGEPVPHDLAPVLEELRRWGWVLGSGELTGVGWSHVGEVNRGVLGGDAGEAHDVL